MTKIDTSHITKDRPMTLSVDTGERQVEAQVIKLNEPRTRVLVKIEDRKGKRTTWVRPHKLS